VRKGAYLVGGGKRAGLQARHGSYSGRPSGDVPAGVGLCEYVQHLAIFDYIAVSGSLEDRVVEYVDHQHEYLEAPAMGPASERGSAVLDGEAPSPSPASGLAR
jgi:hypothetical protein